MTQVKSYGHEVVGDFFNSGRTLFGPGTTVAKVDGKSIDVQEFQRRVEEANQQMQNSGRKIDQAALQQQVLNEMVFETLYKDEINKLGLTVTNSELTEAMFGTGAEALNRMIQQQYGLESAQQLHDMAYNPDKYGVPAETAEQLKAMWVNLENQTEEGLLQQKFNTLFTGAFVANELDAKALYDENGTTSQVAYVNKPYSSLPDEQFEVSDADVEKEWSANKQII
jgi:peptidyl-prolyl cis-trans isomerase D